MDFKLLDVNLVFSSLVALILIALGLGVAVFGPKEAQELAQVVVGGGLALLVPALRNRRET